MIPARVLAVGAHPDDIELYAGGTLSAWFDAGAAMTFVVLTDGRLGSSDAGRDPDEVASIRAQEARAAAARFGAGVVLLGWPDGGLELHRTEATTAIAEAIREHRPDVVVGHDPWRLYELHPDHRAAGLATCDAVVAAREHHALNDAAGSGPAHRAAELWLAGTTQPDRFIDIARTVERKLDALADHASQFEHLDGWRDRVRRWNGAIGAERGYRYGEAFRRIGLPGAGL